ncbi:hypothetical protein TrCOL_g13330 [Triparma columacea]|uniref:F-box domain-containing protein n=1 Tax=Triparma columacea TaxID=722753 RepID=A0A9W7GJQ5_9STRA|nr:hypothetical protein TrCOL_g13330 [Triparma columacea]
MSLKMSNDEAEAPDTAIIPHPSEKTTSLPSLLPTEAYPPPVPGAVLRCYMRNSAPSGSIFCMIWTHVDAGVYSTTSRSGRTSTGLGNVTLKSFHSESEMNKFVFRQISERQSRPGAMAFVDHPVPASLPMQAKPSGKGTKRKVDGNTTSSTTTTTTTTTTITPTSNANLPEDLFPMILSYIGDPSTLVALGRVSWDFNAIVEERVEAMPWAERFYFDQGRKPCITLPEDLRNLNEDWDEQDKAKDLYWGNSICDFAEASGSSGPPHEPPGIDMLLVQIMYMEEPCAPEEWDPSQLQLHDCRPLISPSNYEVAVAIEEAVRKLWLMHGNPMYVDSYGHEGFGMWDNRLVYFFEYMHPSEWV